MAKRVSTVSYRICTTGHPYSHRPNRWWPFRNTILILIPRITDIYTPQIRLWSHVFSLTQTVNKSICYWAFCPLWVNKSICYWAFWPLWVNHNVPLISVTIGANAAASITNQTNNNLLSTGPCRQKYHSVKTAEKYTFFLAKYTWKCRLPHHQPLFSVLIALYLYEFIFSWV